MKKMMILCASALIFSGIAKADAIIDLPLSTDGNDVSASALKGTLKGKAAIKDGALVTDGKKSYLSFPSNDVKIGKTNLTIIAKIKLPSDAKLQPERSTIVGKGGAAANQTGVAFMYRAPRNCLFFYASNGTVRIPSQSNSEMLCDDKWHTVAVSYSRGGKIVFAADGKIRGIRKDTRLAAEDDLTNANDLTIGSWTHGSHNLNGSIKDVKILNTAMSNAELTAATK